MSSLKQVCLNCKLTYDSQFSGFCENCSKKHPDQMNSHIAVFNDLSNLPLTYELCINLHEKIGQKPSNPSRYIQHIFRDFANGKIIIVFFDGKFKLAQFESNHIELDWKVSAFISNFYGVTKKDAKIISHESKNYIYK